jgi:hypothetical protein
MLFNQLPGRGANVVVEVSQKWSIELLFEHINSPFCTYKNAAMTVYYFEGVGVEGVAKLQ